MLAGPSRHQSGRVDQESQHAQLTPPSSNDSQRHIHSRFLNDDDDDDEDSDDGKVRSKRPRKRVRPHVSDSEDSEDNPFQNLVTVDCVNVGTESDAEEESDIDESNFSIGEVIDKFDESSISGDWDYLRCVRRCLVDNLDTAPGCKPTPVDLSRWLLRRDKLNKKPYTRPDVVYDAWSCVLGRCRPNFPASVLIKTYPSLRQKIDYLRDSMGVRLSTTQSKSN